MAKLLVLFLLGGSSVFGFAFAQEGCEPRGERPEETSISSWQVESISYQCGNNQCGGTVQQRTVEAEEKTRTFYTPEEDPETHCPIWKANVVTTSTGEKRTSVVDVPLGKYQACPESANNSWSSNNPAQCSGQCYPAPTVKPVNDGTLVPKNVLDNSGKPKLPLNIGWEDTVELELSRPENRNPDGSSCEVEKYAYTIGPVSGETADRQIIPGGNECALIPNTTYDFTVKACAGGACSTKVGNAPVTTGDAVQLLSPYDPDWQGGNSATTPLPVTLQWCSDPNANSYKFSVYETDKDTNERGKEILTFGTSKGQTQYSDSILQGGFGIFSPGRFFQWEVFPCTDTNSKNCGVGSHVWKVVPGGELQPPELRSPSNNATVNMQDSLSWDFVEFASRYVVRLAGNGAGNKDVFVPGEPKLSLRTIWSKLQYDSTYSWKVAACGGAPESEEISNCGPFSEERVFRTTGATPVGLAFEPLQNGRGAVPVTFYWNAVAGAASYKLQIGGEQSFNIHISKEPEVTVDYPALSPNASNPDAPFAWRVSACADEFGRFCGNAAEGQSFLLAQLQAPTLNEPDFSKTEYPATTTFAWAKDFGSNFFHYQLTFLNLSEQGQSPACQKQHVVAEGLSKESSASLRMRCLGQYEFAIAACVDAACEAKGPEKVLSFTVSNFSGKAGGLIPCDANKDNPATKGVYENEPCELKHLFLLVRNLVDFVLWKLSLIILVLMTAFTGFTMYTSFGGMEVAAKAKSTWKAVGIGFLILLFSWLFLNLFLGLAGFQVSIFGKWYEVVL